MKKILLTESEKKAIILEREQAIINNFAKTFNSIKRVDENEVPQTPENGNQNNNPNEIVGKISKEIPKLINNKAVLQMSDEISKDPKAVEELKKFMTMGGGKSVTENENGVVLPDMNFFKNAIQYGVSHSKDLNEGPQGGNIGAFMGLFAGGAYLAQHFFHPVYEKTILGATAISTHLAGTPIHDPMTVQALGGLAAAILGCIAYNVFKKKKSGNQNNEPMNEYGVQENDSDNLNKNQSGIDQNTTLAYKIIKKITDLLKDDMYSEPDEYGMTTPELLKTFYYNFDSVDDGNGKLIGFRKGDLTSFVKRAKNYLMNHDFVVIGDNGAIDVNNSNHPEVAKLLKKLETL